MRQDLADIINSKLGLAGFDESGDIAALFELVLGLDLIPGYAETLQRFSTSSAAGAAAGAGSMKLIDLPRARLS